MSRSASEVLRHYLAAQSTGDTAGALQLVADDAVFDVGRGRYEGREQICSFFDRLQAVNSRTTVIELRDCAEGRATAVFEQADDDLLPLGIASIRLEVEVAVTTDGRLATFTARPDAESIAALAAARGAGRSSEGLRLAERAGTLPPHTDE